MDVGTRIRLLVGPVRPFVLGKLAFALKKRSVEQRLRAMYGDGGTPPAVEGTTRITTGHFSVHQAPAVDVAELLKAADGFLAGELLVMGSVYRSPFAWHTHPAANARWPLDVWHADWSAPVLSAPTDVPADVRVPHEALRMHHWPLLALAAHLNPKRSVAARYIDACVADMERFLDTYTPGYGIAWAFPMGVGMRLANMLIAWDWICQAGYVNESLGQRLAESAAIHAEFTELTAEWSGGMRTSHYIGCLAGIHAAGVYLVHPQATHWLEAGRKGLERELAVQFLADGMNFEASTGYHVHVTDFFTVARTIDPDIPLDTDRLYKAEHATQVLRACGMPLIGDNDDGMALLPTLRATTGHESLSTPLPLHTAFPDFGLDIYARPDYMLTARCGGVGQWGKGGHAHNDRNSITLRHRIGNAWYWVLVDPGIRTYTGDPQRRNRDRSTWIHATVAVEGREQLAWPRDTGEGLFWSMPDGTRSQVELRTDDRWSGRHNGYWWTHRRTVVMEDRAIHVTDHHRRGVLVFPLGPEIQVEVQPQQAILSVRGKRAATLRWSSPGNVHQTREPWSPAYARDELTTFLRVELEGSVTEWSITFEA